MPREAKPSLSHAGQATLDQYTDYLHQHMDAQTVTIRNYRSDLRLFMAWCEHRWATEPESPHDFHPDALTTPLILRYRQDLQTTYHLKPNTINRALLSIKGYVTWAWTMGIIGSNPAAPVKLLPSRPPAPRHLSDAEESALVAAVMRDGGIRDQTIIVLMLHTGLRVHEVCALRRDQVILCQRSGTLQVTGKGQVSREIPLNATARTALRSYLDQDSAPSPSLFWSTRTKVDLSPRALNHLIRKYVRIAGLTDVRPHDLRHRFGYRMAAVVPLHRLAQMMGHDSLDTTLLYVRGTPQDLQDDVEKIAWV